LIFISETIHRDYKGCPGILYFFGTSGTYRAYGTQVITGLSFLPTSDAYGIVMRRGRDKMLVETRPLRRQIPWDEIFYSHPTPINLYVI